MEITYYGHSCFAVKAGDKVLLFDPFISENPLAKHIDVDAIQANYIFISHGHLDHVVDVEKIGKRTAAKIISSYEIVDWFEKKNLHGHPMNFGGPFKFEFGTVRMVAAVHSSSLPDGAYAGNPGGFLVETDEGNFYFAGDTALTLDMKLIPLFTKLDFAFLPIGSNFTMDYNDAVLAADFIECKKIIGMHYDTFGYIKINQADAQKKFSENGKQLMLMEIGSTILLKK